MIQLFFKAVVGAVLFIGCASTSERMNKYKGASQSEKVNDLFQKVFDDDVARSPMTQTFLGLDTNKDKLDDLSPEAEDKAFAAAKEFLKDLQSFDRSQLKGQDLISYDLMTLELKNKIEAYQWRDYGYPVNQMHGIQSGLTSMMISMHQVKNQKDAEDYVSRLNEFERVFTQVTNQMLASEKKGVMPPKFVFAKVLSELGNITKGAPFDSSKSDSPLWADFKKKLSSLKLESGINQKLMSDGEVALKTSVGKAFAHLTQVIKGQLSRATTDDGVWKFPKGDDFYKYRLKKITTTNYSADFIHRLGLMNVERIHGEMKKIKDQVGFKGDLKAFFKYMLEEKKFYLPQNKSGEEQYLSKARKAIDSMKAQLPKMFKTLPKADVVVKPVEAFRAKTAGLAFYNAPAEDGSRPGHYYVNLSNLKGLPTWELEALAHHEALPGHHMQIAIAQELGNIPKFRRFGRFTAYTEGWGLYSEKLPLEFGFYKDPYANFGRLSMELWRACRLVVDTGLHAKKWSRAKAVKYLANNTPSDAIENQKAIDRYIVLPGQATAYMVGMLKITELKSQAKTSLGPKFDIRDFHDVLLRNGPVPLDMLESLVGDYIDGQRKSKINL